MMTPTKATTTTTAAATASYQARERNDALRAFILSPEALKPVDRPAFRVDWSKMIGDSYKAWLASMEAFNEAERLRAAKLRAGGGGVAPRARRRRKPVMQALFG